MGEEIITKAIIVRSPTEIEKFNIRVNDKKFILIRHRLELERIKIIDIFKQMKEEGKIKSIYRPKNKKIQKDIIRLIDAKRTIEESINKIKEVYYKR